MSRVRGKDTRPEMIVRRTLHALGYRYRLHRRDLPGSPDIVLLKRRAVIFVHGCFWHRHPGCRKASHPKTRSDFWQAKFARNVQRDERDMAALRDLNWHVVVVWECETQHLEELAARMIRLLGAPRAEARP